MLFPQLPGASSSGYKWWEEGELKDLAAAVGLADFRRNRDFRFIMFAATKPAAAPEGDAAQQ